MAIFNDKLKVCRELHYMIVYTLWVNNYVAKTVRMNKLKQVSPNLLNA